MFDNWMAVTEVDREVMPGDALTDFRGDPAVFHAITRVPDGGSSEGRVQVGDGHGPEYYPSVFGLRIVPRWPLQLAGRTIAGDGPYIEAVES